MSGEIVGTLFIALGVGLAALYYVLRPLMGGADEPLPQDEDLIEMISRKESTLAAIKELELDHNMGKISPEDFERFDARLRRQAIVYLQRIEEMMPGSENDEALEAEIAHFRRVSAANASEGSESNRLCVGCGQSLDQGHRFCPACGRASTDDEESRSSPEPAEPDPRTH